MCIVDAKVIGALEMVDGDEHDDKIIAVAGNGIIICPNWLLLKF